MNPGTGTAPTLHLYPRAHCQPGITVTVRNGVESVVSDAIVVLERRDALWAEVVFPAAEIRAPEDPCREQRGHQLSRVLGTTYQLCLPGVGSRELVLTPALTQVPRVASGQSLSLSGTLTDSKLKESTQMQPLLGNCKCQAAYPGALGHRDVFLRGTLEADPSSHPDTTLRS